MKRKVTTLVVAGAIILGCGCVALAAKVGQSNRNKGAPPQITIIVGDVPLSLAVDTYQLPFDPAVLTY